MLVVVVLVVFSLFYTRINLGFIVGVIKYG